MYTHSLDQLIPGLIRAAIFGLTWLNLGLLNAFLFMMLYEFTLWAYTYVSFVHRFIINQANPQMSDPEMPFFMNNPPNTFFVATLNGQEDKETIVATIGVNKCDAQTMQITRLTVRLATRLVDHARAYAHSRGFPILQLETHNSQTSAVCLYSRLGFKVKEVVMSDQELFPGMQHLHGIMLYVYQTPTDA